MLKIIMVCVLVLNILYGDINFDALEAKKSTQSSISIDMNDAVKAADGQWKKKVAENEAEAAYYRELYKNRPIQQAQSLQSSGQKTGSLNNRYICTFTCKGVNEIEQKVQVHGKHNHDAQLKSEKIAKKYCWDTFHTAVVNKWGSGETKYTKQ